VLPVGILQRRGRPATPHILAAPIHVRISAGLSRDAGAAVCPITKSPALERS
jgi:hypothetical protein